MTSVGALVEKETARLAKQADLEAKLKQLALEAAGSGSESDGTDAKQPPAPARYAAPAARTYASDESTGETPPSAGTPPSADREDE